MVDMDLETIADICYKERNEGSKLISVSIVVKDGNSSEIRVYNSNEYGGIGEYNENQI